MKFMLGLLLLVGIGWATVYYAGGYGSFDPNKQGQQARAAVSPGMTHTKAFDACGDPHRVQKIRREVEKVGGEEIEIFVPGPPADTTRERINERIANGDFPYGFVIPYRFSQSVAFAIHFDEAGIVTQIEDLATMANLLQYKD